MFRFLPFCLSTCLLAATHCQQENIPPGPTNLPAPLSILALGDSYTKGESVSWEQNFPNQLTNSLRDSGLTVQNARIIAQTGWRTDQLQTSIATATNLSDRVFSLVTLCIGVNNQYQNGDIETYKNQFEQLLQKALSLAGWKKDRVLVVSIPDWAYTPYGQNFSSGPSAISQKIDQFNAAKQEITESYGIVFVNITPISRMGLDYPELVANDGLHPSAKQYTEWVKLLLPLASQVLKH